jgi:hypothetical protein
VRCLLNFPPVQFCTSRMYWQYVCMYDYIWYVGVCIYDFDNLYVCMTPPRRSLCLTSSPGRLRAKTLQKWELRLFRAKALPLAFAGMDAGLAARVRGGVSSVGCRPTSSHGRFKNESPQPQPATSHQPPATSHQPPATSRQPPGSSLDPSESLDLPAYGSNGSSVRPIRPISHHA